MQEFQEQANNQNEQEGNQEQTEAWNGNDGNQGGEGCMEIKDEHRLIPQPHGSPDKLAPLGSDGLLNGGFDGYPHFGGFNAMNLMARLPSLVPVTGRQANNESLHSPQFGPSRNAALLDNMVQRKFPASPSMLARRCSDGLLDGFQQSPDQGNGSSLVPRLTAV